MRLRWTEKLALLVLTGMWAYCAYQIACALLLGSIISPSRLNNDYVHFTTEPLKAWISLGLHLFGFAVLGSLGVHAWLGQRDFRRWAARNRPPLVGPIGGPVVAGSSKAPEKVHDGA